MPLIQAHEMTYTQVQQLRRNRSIAFLSASALEVHGPHLPLGMDMFMARWQAEETARRYAEAHPDWTVVRYMPLTLGTDELPLRGSMHATQRELYRVLLTHGRSLAEAGYRYVVVTNGHGGPRHASGLEAACQAVSRRYGIEMFTPAIAVLHAIVSGKRFDRLQEILGRPLTEEERSGLLHGEHAATLETSFALAERPDLVDPAYQELKQAGLQHLRDAVGLLQQKATPEEVEDYKRFVLNLAEKVAQAHREDGQQVSPAEQSAIDEITATLG